MGGARSGAAHPIPPTRTTLPAQEAAANKAAGREDWWRLREAALFAVGTVSDALIELSAVGGGALALDVGGLMGSVLAEDLVPTAPPFLIGRALWVTARCGGGGAWLGTGEALGTSGGGIRWHMGEGGREGGRGGDGRAGATLSCS